MSAPAPAVARAVPVLAASGAPTLDGKDDDPVWRDAPAIEDFATFYPTEGGAPRFRTVARVAYDARHLYVVVRAFDPHPDSIVALLSRRDVRTASDQIKIAIDSYHDRRTGYEFAVNPLGVQRDYHDFNDAEQDGGWNAVWYAETGIDSLGWVAEFRIPLSQLRYAPGREHTFGFQVIREIARTGERLSWPLYRRSKPGIPSQFGTLEGLRGLAAPRRIEASPYYVERNVTRFSTDASGRVTASHPQQRLAGADLKVGLGSNLTLDATVNPDFGQVEADPGVLNLTAFEQFFDERRPFFLEGTGIFRYDINCNDGCTGLFYSRRIGRSPQLGGAYGDAATPTASTILGAAKLTGRLGNGLSVGLLDAVTQREVGTGGRTVEPRTNYLVARVVQDLRGGNTVLGAMATATHRALDTWTEDALRRRAVTGGVNFRHRTADRKYEMTGFLAGSRVDGSAAAIARTQRGGVHSFQNPGDAVEYDPRRTSLSGWGAELTVGRRAGVLQWDSFLQRLSPGFEINDVGFLARSDRLQWGGFAGLFAVKPRGRFNRAAVYSNAYAGWNTSSERLELGGNMGINGELRSFVHGGFGVGVNSPVATYDDRAARGGPAVRMSPEVYVWGNVGGDTRKAVVPSLSGSGWRRDEGRSHAWALQPRVQARLASRLQGSVALRYSRRVDDWQWVGNVGAAGADTTRHTFAHLDQTTTSVTTRLDATATRTLSLQLYAQPFTSAGDFSDRRELASPRASRYADRFRPHGDGEAPEGFRFGQLRTNTVVRWEFRPGSTLFAVWAHGRIMDEAPASPRGTRGSLGEDYRDLFRRFPDNTFLVKVSYWLSL